MDGAKAMMKFKVGDRISCNYESKNLFGTFVVGRFSDSLESCVIYRKSDERSFLFTVSDLNRMFDLVKEKFYLDI